MTASISLTLYAGRRQFDAAALNALHRRFWQHEAAKLAQRQADPFVAEEMYAALKREERVPFEQRTAVYDLAGPIAERQQRIREAAAATASSEERRRFAQKGGRNRQQDALQTLICEIAARRPTITTDELLERLQDRQYREVIEDVIDDEDGHRIEFTTERTEAKPFGTSKEAPVSGLRHRLARAKKTMKAASAARAPRADR